MQPTQDDLAEAGAEAVLTLQSVRPDSVRPKPSGSLDKLRVTGAADRQEQALIMAARDGDADALEVLYRQHRGDALRFARSLVNNSHDAEDILHTAFTKTINALANGRGPYENFPAYLCAAIKSVAVEIWKKSSQEFPVERHHLETARTRDPIVQRRPAEPGDAQERITSALKSLPTRWQTVLWYAEVLQEPPRRIGPLMGIKPNAVSALLRRARAGLRTAYQEAEQLNADREWS